MESIAFGGISGIGLGLFADMYPIARITKTFATALADAIMTVITAFMVVVSYDEWSPFVRRGW